MSVYVSGHVSGHVSGYAQHYGEAIVCLQLRHFFSLHSSPKSSDAAENQYGIHKLDFNTISKIHLSSKYKKVKKVTSVTSKIYLKQPLKIIQRLFLDSQVPRLFLGSSILYFLGYSVLQFFELEQVLSHFYL